MADSKILACVRLFRDHFFITSENIFASQTPKDCHFQAPQRKLLGVWESQKKFCKKFPKNSHEPHIYIIYLTIIHQPAAGTHKNFYQIDFCDRNNRVERKMAIKEHKLHLV